MFDLLQSALSPKSVAVIGASDNIHKIGGRPIHYMKRDGFQGTIYPINPTRDEVQGFKSYPSLAALPEAPDMALIVVAGDSALQAVHDCAARGVKTAVVIASGFGEVDEEGRRKQREMTEAARATGMRIIGPNTQGIANFGTGAIGGFSTMFIEVPPMDGPVGIISQSGGMGSMAYGLVRGRGLGVRHVHATGNEADVTVSEMAWAVAHDPDVKLLLLYMENVAHPDILAATARYARERDLPIVAVKAGRSSAGQQAAASHTGSLANEDRVVDAFFRQHGIWRVRDPHGLALAAEGYIKGWRPKGNRVVIVSNSGASCVMGADAVEDAGLTLAQLRPETEAAVSKSLPGFASARNPIDITAALLSNSGLFGDVLPFVAKDPAADMFFIHIPVSGAGYDVERFANDFAKVEKETGKPVVLASWQDNVASVFRSKGVATYDNEAQAIGVLGQLTHHAALLREPRTQWSEVESCVLPPATGPYLHESDTLSLLASRGIRTVKHVLCQTPAQASQAFDEIGGPVVVKACSMDVPHKSEHGLVALSIQSADSAAKAFEQQSAKLKSMGARQDGIIVAAMEKGNLEMMIGARRDPQFGPVVVVGAGGKYVEAMKDCALLLAPFGKDDVMRALKTLRVAPLLDGVRGEPAADVDALADMAVRVGQLMVALGDTVSSIDLNPVMMTPSGPIVVDALLERA